MYISSYTIRKRQKKNRGKKLFYFYILSIVIVISLYIKYSLNVTASEIISPILTSVPSVLSANSENSLVNSAALGEVVKQALIGTQGQYGIYIKNLSTNESYTSDAFHRFDTASIYKLWVMGTVYDQIKSGRLREKAVLTQEVKKLNDKFNIASSSAERHDGTVSLTIDDALEQMITVSDNYAALLLTSAVTLPRLASFLENNGFYDSKVGTVNGAPSTNASDIGAFFEKLYRGKLIDQQYSDKMLSLLKRQRLNEKIPKYLPVDTTIAHKTGELDEFSHDAGIVYTPTGDYIIIVLSNSNSRELANERIANVSKNVFEYFTKQKLE